MPVACQVPQATKRSFAFENASEAGERTVWLFACWDIEVMHACFWQQCKGHYTLNLLVAMHVSVDRWLCCTIRCNSMSLGSVCVTQKVTPRQLDPILAWFREGSDADNKAELIFPPHLTKQQRAKIHTCASLCQEPMKTITLRILHTKRHRIVIGTSTAYFVQGIDVKAALFDH
jgi:hypothetical protein